MKVAVSGAFGFIGSWVVDELQTRGHKVIALDHHARPLDKYASDVEVFLGDVNDEHAMFELAAHCDGVIHLAAQLGTQETIANPRPVFTTNLMGGLNVLESCTRYDKPIVNICVGNYWMNNPYSISKNMFERTVNMFVKERGLRGANVRCVNAYGPRQSAAPPFTSGTGVRKIMPAFACRALSGVPVEVYGDGEQVSDMVYVGDVAQALVRALEVTAAGGKLERTIECGPLVSATVNQVAGAVIKEAKLYTSKYVELVHLPMRPGENAGDKVTCNGNTLLDIGMNPDFLVPLNVGVAKTVKFFHDNEGVTWSKP